MSKHGRGLICAALPEERCDELGLDLMVNNNTALHETAFTVSVDLLGFGCTTGISAQDRAKTLQALINPSTTPADLGRPGHIFPLRAKKVVYFAVLGILKQRLTLPVWQDLSLAVCW